jgi:hypothetical protein
MKILKPLENTSEQAHFVNLCSLSIQVITLTTISLLLMLLENLPTIIYANGCILFYVHVVLVYIYTHTPSLTPRLTFSLY